MQPNDRTHGTGLVWDLPTRLFHWILVALVALAWPTGEGGGLVFQLHTLAGYGVLIALLFRLIWGFAGSRHSRFRDFVRPWRAVRAYAGGLLRLAPRHCVGHNPVGGWMVVALLVTLAVVVATGLFAADDGVAGPLADLAPVGFARGVAELHEGAASLLLGLIGVHVAGVLLHGLIAGENLVRAMWTGRKALAPGEPVSSPAPAWRAALAVATATALTWLLVAR